MKKIKVLNIDILNITRNELLEQLQSGVLFTPNIDHLVKLQSDRGFYEAYRKADWVVCDSRVLQILSRATSHRFTEAIPGSSFFTAFYEHHSNNPECRIFLLGAAEGVAEKARQNINARIGREIVVGALSPSFGFEKNDVENQHIAEQINASGATVVLVGVGAPKQEKWIMEHKHRMPGVRLWMALGATIDFEAGNVSRAPVWMRKLAIEWLYRIIQEPKRMFRRYIVDDLVFFRYFTQQIKGSYRNPFSDEPQ